MESKDPRIIDLVALGCIILGLHVLLNRLLPMFLELLPSLI